MAQETEERETAFRLTAIKYLEAVLKIIDDTGDQAIRHLIEQAIDQLRANTGPRNPDAPLH